jgi:hypothetical protein
VYYLRSRSRSRSRRATELAPEVVICDARSLLSVLIYGLVRSN